ncbi:hypothetical protein N9W02_00400 [Flavobacteriaceae bacterium]|jgi:hypothetical protein|nr:hypothetical protein [Flavobacteriaceae bacterium]MDB2587654.1 hypothetical protein [Flavobacteriaceae bacterium]
MLKFLATILVFLSCHWTVQGQTSLPFRKEAPISVDLYWTKGFSLIEEDRFEDLSNLIADLTNSSLGNCKGFDQQYDELIMVFNSNNKAKSAEAFTKFITSIIILEIHALNSIPEDKARKESILGLFKELIAIQKEIKAIDFETYRQLVNCFRRLNQLYTNPARLKEFVDSQQFLLKYELKC